MELLACALCRDPLGLHCIKAFREKGVPRASFLTIPTVGTDRQRAASNGSCFQNHSNHADLKVDNSMMDEVKGPTRQI